jgi:hypothetical protein
MNDDDVIKSNLQLYYEHLLRRKYHLEGEANDYGDKNFIRRALQRRISDYDDLIKNFENLFIDYLKVSLNPDGSLRK